MVIPGALTLTLTDANVVAMKPGIDALTTVVPPEIGSNAMPPLVTLPESNWPPPIVTVRLRGPQPASVVRCATLPLLLVTVAVTDDPARTAITDRLVLPL